MILGVLGAEYVLCRRRKPSSCGEGVTSRSLDTILSVDSIHPSLRGVLLLLSVHAVANALSTIRHRHSRYGRSSNEFQEGDRWEETRTTDAIHGVGHRPIRRWSPSAIEQSGNSLVEEMLSDLFPLVRSIHGRLPEKSLPVHQIALYDQRISASDAAVVPVGSTILALGFDSPEISLRRKRMELS